MKIFAGSSSELFTDKLVDYLGVATKGNVSLGRFPDGEISVQLNDNVRGKEVFIVQSMGSPVNDNLMELLIMIDAAKRASASRVTAVIPFFGYARQDRKDKPRVPITAKLVSNIIVSAGADRILTIDLHSPQIQGFFDIPVDHLYARPVFVPLFRKLMADNKEGIVMVSPDTGGAKEIYKYAEILGCGFAIVGKQRLDGATTDSKILVGDVSGKVAIMVDDLTTTCGTLCGASKLLSQHGAKRIVAAVTHNLMTDDAIKNLEVSEITEFYTTDTVIHKPWSNKITIHSVSELFAKAIDSIHNNDSVSSLFAV